MKSLMRLMRFFKIFSSLKFTVICLLLLAALVAAGTFYEVEYGLAAAHDRFFGSWFFFVAPWFPLPGVKAALAAVLLNLIAAGFAPSPSA